MDNLIIEKTKFTLGINIDAKERIFTFEGRSLPENTYEFFHPVFSYIKRFISETKEKLTFNFKIIYFNSGSSKRLNELFRILEDHQASGGEVEINWYYEKDDEDQLEEGEEFAEDFELKFEMIPY